MSLKKNLVYNYILSASQVLLPIVSIPYVSRVLTPEGIGRVSFIDSFTYYFISIAEFGIVVYGMRAIARERDNPVARGKLVSELLVLHLITSGIALLLYSIAVFFAWQHIRDVRLLLFSLSFLLVNFFACEWYFRGMEHFRYITLRSLLSRGLGLLSIFILIKGPEDYYVYYGIIAGSAILNSIWNNYYLLKEVHVTFKNIDWKKHIPHTRLIWFISLTYSVTLLLDNVLLSLVSTVAMVGLYAFAVKMVRIATSLVTDSLLVFFPRIVSLRHHSQPGSVQLILLKNLQLLIFFVIPLSIGFFSLADELVLVFLGRQFEAAIVDVKLLAVFPCIKACNLFLGNQVLMSHHAERAYLKSLLASSLVFVAGTLALSYQFGDRGACVALLLAEAVTCLLNFYYVRNLLGSFRQLLDGRSLLSAIVSSSLFIPAIYMLKQTAMAPIAILAVAIITCMGLYLSIQFFVFRNPLLWAAKEWLTGSFYNWLLPVDKQSKRDEL